MDRAPEAPAIDPARLPFRLIAVDPLSGQSYPFFSADGRTWQVITRQGRFEWPDDPRRYPQRLWQNRPF